MARTFTGTQLRYNVNIAGFTPDLLAGWTADYFSQRKTIVDKCGRYLIDVIKNRFDTETGYTGRWAELSNETLKWRESHGYVYGPKYKKLRNRWALYKSATRLNSNTRMVSNMSSHDALVTGRWQYEPNARNPQGVLLTLEGEQVGMLQAGGLTPTGGVVPGRPFWYITEENERQFKRYIEQDILKGLRKLNYYRRSIRRTPLDQRIGNLGARIREVENNLGERNV